MHLQPGATKWGGNISSLLAISSSPTFSKIDNISLYNKRYQFRWLPWFHETRFWGAGLGPPQAEIVEVFWAFLRKKCFKKWSIWGSKNWVRPQKSRWLSGTGSDHEGGDWYLLIIPEIHPKISSQELMNQELMETPRSPNEAGGIPEHDHKFHHPNA